jgi:outer membrane protein assembly factor BamB
MRRLASAVLLPIALVAGCSAAGTPTSHVSIHPGGPGAKSAASKVKNWPTYHNNASRTGHTADAVKMPLHHSWTAKLDGGVYGEPIYVNGTLIAATENDTVYGLNPKNGHVKWHTHLGTAETQAQFPDCGDVFPLGITGTPAQDAKTGSVFAVATTGTGHHTLWALNAATGKRRWHRNVDVDKARDRNAEQQRSALLVVDNRVILTYGAHAGDCDNYVGYAASVATNGKGKIPFYAVPNARQAGMWSPAGPVRALDGNLLTPTANGSNRTGGKWDHSDGVLELNPKTMHFVRGWAPSNWEQGDADDLSLSSTTPVPVDGKYVVGGKRGDVWLLKRSLGGVNGQLKTLTGCQAYGGEARVGRTVLLPCREGVKALVVTKHSMHWTWSSSVYGSPVIAGSRVFLANGPTDGQAGTLTVLSLKTGHTETSISVGPLTHFPSQIVVGNRIFVPTLTGISAVRGS